MQIIKRPTGMGINYFRKVKNPCLLAYDGESYRTLCLASSISEYHISLKDQCYVIMYAYVVMPWDFRLGTASCYETQRPNSAIGKLECDWIYTHLMPLPDSKSWTRITVLHIQHQPYLPEMITALSPCIVLCIWH